MDEWDNNVSVNIANSDLQVSRALVYAAQSQSVSIAVTLSDNELACGASGVCDLTYGESGGNRTFPAVTLSGNNISCPGDASQGCRGFTLRNTNMTQQYTLTQTLVVNGNYWYATAGHKVLDDSTNLQTAVDLVYSGGGPPYDDAVGSWNATKVVSYGMRQGGSAAWTNAGWPTSTSSPMTRITGAGRIAH
jgi:hypothetical protein